MKRTIAIAIALSIANVARAQEGGITAEEAEARQLEEVPAQEPEINPEPETPAEPAPREPHPFDQGSESLPPVPPAEPPPDPHAGALDPCATDLRSRPIGPLQVGELDGMLGVPMRACPRDEVALGGGLLLVADSDHFYGDIRVDGRLRVSAVLDPNVEGFVSWEAFRFQRLISSVSADYVGLGYLSWGLIARVFQDNGRVYAITGRIVLPTTMGLDQRSQPVALDVGLSGAWQADPNFRFHLWITLLGSVGVSTDGPADPRGGVRLGGGVDWRPFEWLSFVLEIQSGFGYRDALDLLAVNAGVRLALGSEVGVELAGQVPFFGTRAIEDGAIPIAASLNVSWRFR